MQYLEPVYRGKVFPLLDRGERSGKQFEYVHIKATDITPSERRSLEEIARRNTYTLGLFGHQKHFEDHQECRVRGARNKVRFIVDGNTTSIYIRGPLATYIGSEIENLPFVRYSSSKNEVVSYDLEEYLVR